MLFRETLFWDADLSKLDKDQHAAYIITRVAERGLLRDWKELFTMYPEKKITDSLLNASWLDKRTLNYVSLYFKIPKESFKCYTKHASRQGHWGY